jgi:hypothetical protein
VQFTLRDAIKAVEESYSPESNGQSALMCYFRIKCTSVMFLAFVIAIVLRGSTFMVNTINNLIGNVTISLFG